MKRAGRGHDLTGVRGTAQGELALKCRACPQDGMNLTDGWDKINWDTMPEDLRYIFSVPPQLLVAESRVHTATNISSLMRRTPIFVWSTGMYLPLPKIQS
jgi:hypothetical protein